MFNRRTLAQLMAAAALAPASVAAQGRPPLSRIAFGSCADQAKPQPIWDAILAYRPELFIFAGDNVYGDFNSADAANLKRAYDNGGRHRRLQQAARDRRPSRGVGRPRLRHQRRRRRFPAQGGGEGVVPEVLEGPRHRHRRTREGIYNSQHHRPAGHARADHPARPALVPLATESSPTSAARRARNAMSPIPIPAKTMLGPLQWAWLAGELRKPAEIRLIVSSTQVLAEGHGWERWGNLPLERQKLFDTIRDSGAKGVVLLSGDRHIGALYRETPPGLHPLYELTSSGLNMVYWAAKEPGPNRAGRALRCGQFRRGRHRLVGTQGHAGAARRRRQHAAIRRFSASMNWDLPDDWRKCHRGWRSARARNRNKAGGDRPISDHLR